MVPFSTNLSWYSLVAALCMPTVRLLLTSPSWCPRHRHGLTAFIAPATRLWYLTKHSGGLGGNIWLCIQSNLHLLLEMVIFRSQFQASPNLTWNFCLTPYISLWHIANSSISRIFRYFPALETRPQRARKAFPFLPRAHFTFITLGWFSGEHPYLPIPSLTLVCVPFFKSRVLLLSPSF